MPWIVLLISAVFESVWATALGESAGLTHLTPTIIFFVALTISMAGLGWSAKHIPIGTAYAIWVGVGAALTVLYATIANHEPISALKVLFLTGIIAAVIGLKLAPGKATEEG
ncbi:DMT family transporter [Kribbella solani]|uniref:Quaternary ammonium compound-resistance protein SugE n=1 Tax=Kribbella solani TaxID=236067 RepID=A0A841DJ65_9ACTN|nr:multidrug efflux SMR transporter [Kribbella solani]MBB5977921.1 quaternary ammonium compound-resistance protein SugE [Kribbella solani]